MYHTLFTLFGVSLTSYRASKALAAVVAAIMLGREFRRLGWNPEVATTLVVTSTVVGFLGAKLYYLGKHAANLSMHDFGRFGFTYREPTWRAAAEHRVLQDPHCQQHEKQDQIRCTELFEDRARQRSEAGVAQVDQQRPYSEPDPQPVRH